MSASDDKDASSAEPSVVQWLEHDEAYRVDHRLAQGDGSVTEVVWKGQSGPYVRKRLRQELTSKEVWQRLGEVLSPHLPQLIDLYELPGELVAVTSFVPGETLDELVKREGALAATRAAEILASVAVAAQALHDVGVIHRDITPKNVIVGPLGACLIDVGIARVVGDVKATKSQVQHDTTVLGTWGFAAPEQFGFKTTNAQSDVYGLGRLLGFMLTGCYPDKAAYGQTLTDPHRVSPAMARVVARASAFEPSERYASAQALANEVLAAAKRSKRAALGPGGRRRVGAAVGIAAAVGVAGLGLWLGLGFFAPTNASNANASVSAAASSTSSASKTTQTGSGGGEPELDAAGSESSDSWYDIGRQVGEDYAQGLLDGSSKATQSLPNKSDQASQSTSDGMSKEPASELFSVTIDAAQVTKDYEGKPALQVSFSFTNRSEETTNFLAQFIVYAYQDGKQLDLTGGSDMLLTESTKNLRPGASNTCYELFALTSTNPVDVEVFSAFEFDAPPVATKTFTLP